MATTIPKVKICCIGSPAEAAMAMHYGASAIGLVAKMPSGPGPIEDDLIKKIAAVIPPPIATFLLTSETSSQNIIDHHKRTFTNTIQLVDELQVADYEIIKEALPAIKLVQVIHVIDESSIEKAVTISKYVHAVLLDSGNPNLAIKELGGTGRVHDWKLSRRIVEALEIPVFLAGGLHAGNVRQAIEEVRPYAVDVCSGVRTGGKLDEEKITAFFSAINKNL